MEDLQQVIHILHVYFIEDSLDLIELIKREFYQRKCSSYKKGDVDKHYQEMNMLYYGIGADVNLKPLFFSSIPEDLSVKVEKSFLRKNK